MENILDVRDLITRFEELETLKESNPELFSEGSGTDQRHEFAALEDLLNDLAGNGGDEQWRGSWYPITLVMDSYWKEFVQDEADSLELINTTVEWPYTCIDWERASRELQQDYSFVDFQERTYWYR